MTFWGTVRAYLTGWVIAQAIFNRVMKGQREKAYAEMKTEIAQETAYLLADLITPGCHVVDMGPSHHMTGAKQCRRPDAG